MESMESIDSIVWTDVFSSRELMNTGTYRFVYFYYYY